MTELIDRVYARCRDDGGCKVWTGAMGRGIPQLRDGDKTLYPRRIVCEHKHGPLPEGMIAGHTCETRGCVEHVEPMTRSQRGKQAGATGIFSSLIRCQKISATKRERAGVLTPEQVADICYSAVPASHKAAEYGISRFLACAIRRGERHKEYGNHFSGLGARS